MNLQIINAEKIIELIGYWPKFCDAKINRFSFDLYKKNVELIVFYIDADQGKSLEIEFKFENVSYIDLNSLRVENVIDELTFFEEDGAIRVNIESTYGLRGRFMCGIASVTCVHKNPSFNN